MNISLVSLVTSLSLNPCPLLASSSLISNTFTSHCVLKRFSNSYFFGNNIINYQNNNFFSFHKSSFANFLNSPLSFSSISLFKRTFDTTQELSLETIITVKNCNFFMCKTNEFGGAIYVDNTNSNVSFASNEFLDCSSAKHGGGFFISCRSFESVRDLTKHCYVGTSCSYQSFFIIVTESLSMNKAAVYSNGDNKTAKSYCTAGLKHGIQEVTLTNFSSNHHVLWGSAISISHNSLSSLEMDQCTFYNNTQELSDIFYFIGVGQMCEITDNNIVENKCSKSGTAINALANAYVHFRNCAFLKNVFGQIASSDSIAVVLFEGCVCDFEIVNSETVHQVDSVFKKAEFASINIPRVE